MTGYNGRVYALCMALIKRLVRKALDLDATEAWIAEYAARLDSYMEEE